MSICAKSCMGYKISSPDLQRVIRSHGLPHDFDFPLSLSRVHAANREASSGPMRQTDSHDEATLLPFSGLCSCIVGWFQLFVGTSSRSVARMSRDLMGNRSESPERGYSQGDPAGAFTLRFKACQGLIGELSFDGDELFADSGQAAIEIPVHHCICRKMIRSQAQHCLHRSIIRKL